VADQLRWARFHLGDGRAESGGRVLPAEVLRRMKEPTVALRSSTLGDAIGIGWFLRDVAAFAPLGTAGRRTDSSLSCSPCPGGSSPSSRCPTPARTMASSSTRPSSAGRCRPTCGGLLPGDADEYIIISGGLKGQRGFFTRDDTGAVAGVDLAGRLFNRTPTASLEGLTTGTKSASVEGKS
jgi:hypothetical protein